MLVEFTVGNFLSFKENTTLSMVASKDNSLPQNVIKNAQGTGIDLLKSAVIYGANASGKSNFVKAMEFMREVVLNSMKSDEDEKIKTKPFKLDQKCLNKPSHFEIVYIQGKVRYQYGFELTSERVYKEWMYSFPKGQKRILFERNQKSGKIDRKAYSFGTHFKGDKWRIVDITDADCLFISMAKQMKNPIAENVITEFSKKFDDIPAFSILIKLTSSIFASVIDKNDYKLIESILTHADFGINSFRVEQKNNKLDDIVKLLKKESPETIDNEKVGNMVKAFLDDMVDTEIVMIHKLKDHSEVEFAIDEESEGTQRFLAIILMLIVLMKKRSVIISDEFDLKLHPQLTAWLINSMHDEDFNKNSTQMIYTTHNTDLLDRELFRRDQIWFTEKSRETGATELYSLWDFKARKDENIRKNYLLGRYGAVPILEKFEL